MNTFHSSVNSFSRTLTSFFDDRLSRFDLATSYVELMILMKKSEEVSQKDLADQLSLAPSTVTRFVEKLKNHGYLTKKRDGRNMTIELTEAGRKASAEMEREYESIVQEISDMMGDKYLETIGKLLDFGSQEISKSG